MENQKYIIKQGYIVREIAGEYIAVPVDSSIGTNIVVLNSVSKFIWEELKKPKAFDELLEAMLKNYTVSKEEAEADLTEFISQLQDSSLLEQ